MLFILTNSQDATASFLVSALQKSGAAFLRLDTDGLLPRIALSYRPGKPLIRIDNVWQEAAEVSHVWYRRPEQLKDDRFDSSPESNYARAEWSEFIEGFFAHVPKQKWVNHPSCNAAASRKLEQLTMAAVLGFSTPDTLVTQEPSALRAFYDQHRGRIIAKPLSTGYIERHGEQSDSLIYTSLVFEDHLRNLDDLKACPTLFQQFIEKAYDVRITVVDSDIHAVALFGKDKGGGQRCDIRRDNMSGVTYSKIELPEDVRTGIVRMMAHYALRFAAIDMAVSAEGQWCFFEINPNGQWAWLDTDAGTNIAESFVRSFSGGSAQKPTRS